MLTTNTLIKYIKVEQYKIIRTEVNEGKGI